MFTAKVRRTRAGIYPAKVRNARNYVSIKRQIARVRVPPWTSHRDHCRDPNYRSGNGLSGDIQSGFIAVDTSLAGRELPERDLSEPGLSRVTVSKYIPPSEQQLTKLAQ